MSIFYNYIFIDNYTKSILDPEWDNEWGKDDCEENYDWYNDISKGNRIKIEFIKDCDFKKKSFKKNKW